MEIKTTEQILIEDMYEDVFNKEKWLKKKWIAINDDFIYLLENGLSSWSEAYRTIIKIKDTISKNSSEANASKKKP